MLEDSIMIAQEIKAAEENNTDDVEVTTVSGQRAMGWYHPIEKIWRRPSTDISIEVIAWKEKSRPYSPGND